MNNLHYSACHKMHVNPEIRGQDTVKQGGKQEYSLPRTLTSPFTRGPSHF